MGIESQFGLIAGVLAGLLVGVAWTWHHEHAGRDQGQAALVAGRVRTIDDRVTGAVLTNGSELPVFSVVAWVVATSGAAPASGEEWVTKSGRTMGNRRTARRHAIRPRRPCCRCCVPG